MLDNRTVLIGIDAATWNIIDFLCKNNYLPNFKSIIKKGFRSTLISHHPQFTPVVWTSIATGQLPDKHGALGFFSTSKDVTSKRLWDILQDKLGAKVGVYQWPITYPVKKNLNGFMVSVYEKNQDIKTNLSNPVQYSILGKVFNVKKVRISKNFILNYLYNRFTIIKSTLISTKYGLSYKTAFSYIWFTLIKNILPRNEFRYRRSFFKRKINSEVYFELLKIYKPDFTAYYIAELDHFGHKYWRPFVNNLKRSSLKSSNINFGLAIPKMYKQIDDELGKILGCYDLDKTNVIIASDHGMRGVRNSDVEISIDNLIKLTGISDHLKSGDPWTSLSDDHGLSLWKLGSKVYAISDNKKSLFSIKKFKTIIKNIKLEDSDECVFDIEDNGVCLVLSQNSNHNKLYEKNKNNKIVCDNRKLQYDEIFLPFNIDIINGVHDNKGIFFAKGPNISSGFDLDTTEKTMSVLDVLPNLLYLNNLPIAKNMDGKIVEQIFTKDFISKNQVNIVENYDVNTSSKPSPTSKQDLELREEVKKELRELGYL